MEIKKLDDLNLTELQAVAITYGLDIKAKNANQIKTDLTNGTSIDPDRVEVPAIGEDKKPVPKYKGRTKVIFSKTDGPDGSNDIKVTVNGYRYRIKREHPVDLPDEALHVIDNAIVTEVYYDSDGVQQERKRKRFSYQRV